MLHPLNSEFKVLLIKYTAAGHETFICLHLTDDVLQLE